MSKEQQVHAALQRIDGASRFFGHPEIKELPRILWEDEIPERILQGRYNEGNGLLVATNKRLVFIDKGIIRLRVEDFPYDKISSIEYSTGLVFGKLTIYCSGNRAVIDLVLKDQVREFADYVRARTTKVAAHASAATSSPLPTPVPQEDPLSRLERLTKLRDQGALSPDEFDALKRKLVSDL